MFYLICKCSGGQVLQTMLIAQSHEERTKLELVRQVPVLCVIPYEHKLKGSSVHYSDTLYMMIVKAILKISSLLDFLLSNYCEKQIQRKHRR